MNEVIVIRTGYKYCGDNWNSFIDGYFESVIEAESFLESSGYEHNYDDVYSMRNQDDITVLARIEGLKKIKLKKE